MEDGKFDGLLIPTASTNMSSSRLKTGSYPYVIVFHGTVPMTSLRQYLQSRIGWFRAEKFIQWIYPQPLISFLFHSRNVFSVN
jgi:hypothetical protein